MAIRKLYTVSNQKGIVRPFNSIENVYTYIDDLNKKQYDNAPYSAFGTPVNWETGEKLPYTIDSVVLTKIEYSREVYHKFLIQCFNVDTLEEAEIEI
jgi:hypothetical protein